MSTTLRPRRTRRSRPAQLAVLTAILLTVGLGAGLRWHANAVDHGARAEPMPVPVTTYSLQDNYQRQRRFLGLVEAGHRADLGFEAAGELAAVRVGEGETVSAGQVLATQDDRRLRAERAAVAADLATLEADLELAQLKARRLQDLQATGAASRDAHDETRLRATALAAQRDAATARLRRLDIELEKTRLLAPYAGVVAARYLDPGTITAPGTPVLRLIQTGGREAHVGVAPTLAERLEPGRDYTLRWRDQEVPATLRAVRPDVDPGTRAATAVFNLPAQSAALDGETVSLALPDTVASRGGWLPVSALLEGQRGIWNVLVVEPGDGGHITTRHVVEVLEIQGDKAFVYGTLADGQAVVADGLHRIAPGAAVTPLEL